MLIRNACKPLTHITRVHLALCFLSASSDVLGLFLKRSWLVKSNFSLHLTAVHARASVLTGSNLLDFLDDAREFSGTNTVFGDDVLNSGPVVILLGKFRIGRMRLLC